MEIEIDINNKDIFAKLAYNLDQDNLLEQILKIRKCWLLEKELISYDNFENWIEEPHYDFSLSPEAANYWSIANDNLPDLSFTRKERSSLSEEKLHEIANANPMDMEIEYLLRQNGLIAGYKKLILKAIICGKVNLFDWNETNINTNFSLGEWWFNIPYFENIYKGATKPEIVRDREWYWLHKHGKPILRIAKETKHKPAWMQPEEYEETVKSAVKRYKSFLKNKGHE